MLHARSSIAIGVLLLAGLRLDIQADKLDPNRLPPADVVMKQVLAALPGVPLRIQAQMQTKSRLGASKTVLNTEMYLDWHAVPPSARYTLRDAFGASLESINVLWNENGEIEYLYYKGDPLAGSPLPNLYGQIQNTDISWIDLSMSFLWWPYGKTVGVEEIKGRECYIIDTPSPLADTNTYAGVRVWIDPQSSVLLQAVAYDLQNQEIKKLEVKSFKKINDVWMIRDVEVQSLPGKSRTMLRIRQVEEKDRKLISEESAEDDMEESNPAPISAPATN